MTREGMVCRIFRALERWGTAAARTGSRRVRFPQGPPNCTLDMSGDCARLLSGDRKVRFL